MKLIAGSFANAALVALVLAHPRAEASQDEQQQIRAASPVAVDSEDTYLGQVERYAHGDREGAVQEVMTWPERRIRTESRGGLTQRTVATLKAAAMLHTDCALHAHTLADMSAAVRHTEAAQCVVTELEQRPECDAFALRWYLAMSYHLMSRVLDVDAARQSLERGLQRFAQDPQLRLGLGTVEEMGALRRVTQISTPPELRPGEWNLVKPARPTRDRRTCRLLAEREYRRALEADPALVEAHLRRGRVSAELGRTDDAEHELEWVVGHSREPSMLYLAHLFRGAIHQRAGRLDAAAVSYRSAVAQDPACQTGNIALGHVLEQLGERAGALEAWRKATAGHDHDDAWWLYPLGRLKRSEALLAALRQEATR